MASWSDFEASVFGGRVVKKQHRRGDSRGRRGLIGPIGKVLVQYYRAALLRALQVQLLGEQDDFLFADHILARLEEPPVKRTSMQLFIQMSERLDALHKVRVAGLPLHDRF